MANTIVWADIPVNDMDRARAFYGKVLQAEIAIMGGSAGAVALPPMDADGVGGDLVLSEESKPGAGGITVYLNSDGDAEIPDQARNAPRGYRQCSTREESRKPIVARRSLQDGIVEVEGSSP